MKYQLTIQFSEAFVDYDLLIEVENELIEALPGKAEIDGHDLGSGEGNIFIYTDVPADTFAWVKKIVDGRRIPAMKAAYRLRGGEQYTILWPPGLTEFKVS